MDAQDEYLVTVIRRLDRAGETATSYRIAQEWVEPPQFLDERLGRLVGAGWLVINQTTSPTLGPEHYQPGPKAPPST
jgi:hypothetical protein